MQIRAFTIRASCLFSLALVTLVPMPTNAGRQEKCSFATEEFGFDVCLDQGNPRLSELLVEACPKGFDVYFE